ncbi:hypothetical protein M595_3937 [Lyngbya aestuarii BL J]|uniref:Uncharacterized protein n=1 Tax=Lyngbya aestuarii BL J TaxID=1348334 RepID=U7QI81_9CYAN|nr:hypothetical protein [Lyngbya aestuarii]ERT06136.1 hypothetical protein M595_3937 [Lyngbya aestuarii BL J]
MSYQQDDNHVKRRLEELEAELKQPQPVSQKSSPSDFRSTVKTLYNQFLVWFKELPKLGQAAIVVVGLAMGLTLLRTLAELISLAISLAVVGVIVYIGYQIFKSSKFSK